jgi:excisionase family DNA binding protein
MSALAPPVSDFTDDQLSFFTSRSSQPIRHLDCCEPNLPQAVLSPAELKCFIEEVASRLAARLTNRPKLVGRHDLAEILGVSVPTIERLQRDKRIPLVRIGRRVLYSPDAVIGALNEVPPMIGAAQPLCRSIGQQHAAGASQTETSGGLPQ